MLHSLFPFSLLFPDPVDYVEIINGLLTIPAGSERPFEACSSVTIKGDLIREDDETFSVVLTPENSNDIITSTVSFRVTILDDGDG